MNINRNHTIAVFHRDQLNRKAVIELLSDDFNCFEIENWSDITNSKAETIIILSPEILYPSVSFDEMRDVIENLNAKVLMVNYDDSKWWIFRPAFVQLKRPSLEQFRKGLRAFCSEEKSKRVFFKKWIRA